jgi:hypothetical protein
MNIRVDRSFRGGATMKQKRVFVAFTMLLAAMSDVTPAAAQEEVFSGPQVGEALVSFETRSTLGEEAGETFDLIKDADGKPVLIIFVHNVTRPSIGLTRTVVEYAQRKWSDKLKMGIVFLSADATDTETWLKRASHAIPQKVPVGVSVDGLEGPGAYGLNRQATLTVLVGNKNKVTGNFALVQPSLTADAPTIGKALVDVMGGGDAPTLAEMAPNRPVAGRGMEGRFRAMLGPVINKKASPEEVKVAADKVEELAAKNQRFRMGVGQRTRRIVESGRLATYGTPEAQMYLKKWAEEYR